MTEWARATHTDVPGMVNLSEQHYAEEFESVMCSKNLTRFHYNLHQAILKQTYTPDETCVLVARNDKILAWSWLERGRFMPYSDDEMAAGEILHVDSSLTARHRVRLVRECLQLWILWARTCGIPILTSSSIRPEQAAFMRLHAEAGFTIRGSYAFQRLQQQGE
jgi:hypothetical protein